MKPELNQLFRCERYLSTFPAGMPFRACLRRQLERQESMKKGQLGPPRKPFCAERCELGRANREAFPDLELGACRKCGGALLGTTECAPCAERALVEERGRARGFLPAGKPPPQERIWRKGGVDPAAELKVG